MVSSTKRAELKLTHYQRFSDYKKNLITRYEKNDPLDQFSLPWDNEKTGLRDREGYAFLNRNEFLPALVEDFNQLEPILSLPEGGDNDELIALARYLYGHYANLLLSNETFYNKPDEIIRYQAIVTKMGGLTPNQKSKFNQLMDELGESIGVPYFSNKLLSLLGLGNAYRLSIVFSRLSWKDAWLLSRALGILDQFDNINGHHINIGILDAPTDLFNGASVGIFLAKFLVHLSLANIHTNFPTYAEEGLSKKERWDLEVEKRYVAWVNDGLWALVNLLTNYAWFFHIPGPLAGALLAIFLGFDIYWLIHVLGVAEKAYFAKEAEYNSESQNLEFSPTSIRLIALQLKNLKNQRYEIKAKLFFCVAAGFVLAASFSLTLIFATPLAFIIGYLGCVLGAAMYITHGKFGAYARARLENSKSETCQDAWDSFVKSILKTTLIPILIVGAFTINWPGAILLTVLYFGYEFAAPESLKQNEVMPFVIASVCLVSWQAALLLTAFYIVYQTADNSITHSRLSVKRPPSFWENAAPFRQKQTDEVQGLELDHIPQGVVVV